MDEKKIAERVAKSFTGGSIKLQAYADEKVMVAGNIVAVSSVDGKRTKTGQPLVRVDANTAFFDAEQLDTFIDTLQSAKRRM